MHNLIVCCDGTWNTSDQKDDGVPIPTNVVRFYNALADKDKNNNKQLKYYHPGVGVEKKWWKKVGGGAFGLGLSQNIMSAYKWLGCKYECGDRIFLIGFSRGAYTVRSLAGMITSCGLLDLKNLEEDQIWDRVQKIYKESYRSSSPEKIPCEAIEYYSDQQFGAGKVFFVGVWDTVGALGIPDELALLNLLDNKESYAFHDHELNENILHARHAMAIDEMRASFSPALWYNIQEKQDVKQVWFPGVHSDVGGGYLEKGLSDGALKWMIDEAGKLDLKFNPEMYKQVIPDYQDVVHDSYGGGFKLLHSQPRNIPRICTENEEVKNQKSGSQSIHHSVLARSTAPSITQTPYRTTILLEPGQCEKIDIFAYEHWNNTGVYLEDNGKYSLRASGQWLDRSIKCSPEGSDDGKFQLAELVQMAGGFLGKIERLYKRIFRNEKCDFIGTRRKEEYPWFSLVGTVTNGENSSKESGPPVHETFLIGKGVEFSPVKPGYLYCFANDAWHFYGNNRGFVTLEITRKE